MRSGVRIAVLSFAVALAGVGLGLAARPLLGTGRYIEREYAVTWAVVAMLALSIVGRWLMTWTEHRKSGIIAASVALLLLFSAAACLEIDLAISALVLVVILGAGLGLLYLLWRVASMFVYQRDTQLRVIGQLASVIRQNLPLPAGLSLASQSEQGWARVHLHRISGLLTSGMSLSEAIQRGYPDCPSMVQSLVLAGERTGQLSAALDESERYISERTRRRERPDLPFWPYAIAMLASTSALATLLLVAVLPRLKEIFKDFGIRMPVSTQILFWVATEIADYGVFLLPLLLFIPIGLYLMVRPRRFPDLTWTSRLADWLRWRLPGLHRLESAHGLAAMFRTMRLAVRSGLGLEPAARLAADIDVNRILRTRMTCFADLVREGVNSSDAAHQAGLGAVTGMALASGQRSGDLDAALRYAAEYHDALISRWWIVLSNLVWPTGTLLVALVVGGLVLAFFQPIVALLDGTMTSIKVLQ